GGVVALGRLVQAEVALVDQLEQREALALVAARDGDDEAEVPENERIERRGVFSADAMHQILLLLGSQDAVAIEIAKVKLLVQVDHGKSRARALSPSGKSTLGFSGGATPALRSVKGKDGMRGIQRNGADSPVSSRRK